MRKYDIPIVRIVVDGKPALKKKSDNLERASHMLYKAFSSQNWPGKALFAQTPGGFIKGKFPLNWAGQRGWESRRDEFDILIGHALPLVTKVLSQKILEIAKNRARYLTLGIDLKDPETEKLSRRTSNLHVELVCVVDLQTGEPIHWTGKSYPVNWQENWLVQEVNLKSHLFRCSGYRVLILGCHDLNMFSERSKTLAKQGTRKYRRIREMRKITKEFSPTIVLHHPHSTDSPNIWKTAWSGVRKLLANSPGKKLVWASGIAFFNGFGGLRRGALDDVMLKMRSCEEHVFDVIVTPR